MDRPEWDEWFLALAYVVSQRSIDTSSKCGCVITDQDHTILSVGYNGPPRGSDDAKIPMTRPEKYFYMEHAESNAISNAARTGIQLKDVNFYVTGKPCHLCLRKILNFNTKKLVHGDITVRCIDEESRIATENMLKGRDIELVIYSEDKIKEVLGILDMTKNQVLNKLEEVKNRKD